MNREALSPEKPLQVVTEQEPDGRGGQVETTTIFLTASECPVGCNMCDLHRSTLLMATPDGAIPKQIDAALTGQATTGWLKLYNSGNFFDPRSVPPSDYPAIAERCAGFSRVVVENHPRFGADRLRRFHDLLAAPLEVAVGLETIQPRWLRRLGKQMSRDDFDRYARWLRDERVDLRVFLIVGVPGIDARESVRWARMSVRHAVAQRARHISLIPARAGHGWNGRADELPELTLPQLGELQQAAIKDADGAAAITVDLWDVGPEARGLEQLKQTNLYQQAVLQ